MVAELDKGRSDLNIGLVLLSADWEIVGMNDHVVRLAEEATAVMGRPLLDFHPQAIRARVEALLKRLSGPAESGSNSIIVDMFERVLVLSMSRLTLLGAAGGQAEWAVSFIDITEQTGAISNSDSGQLEMKRLPVYENGIFHFLAAEQICAIEADGNYCRIYTGIQKHYLLMSLKSVLEKFASPDLFRVHKSFIVNLRQIARIESGKEGMTIRFGDPSVPSIPVSRRRAAALKKALLN